MTYDEFAEIFYQELDQICLYFERNANRLEKLTEDNINFQVCGQLIGRGYNATHDENNKGHSDITIKYLNFIWIGEGKKLTSANNSYLLKGYDQLKDRYTIGKSGSDKAALLAYVYAPDSAHVMAEWKQHLTSLSASNPAYKGAMSPCPSQPNHAFYSEFPHPSSGRPCRVRHVAFSLHLVHAKKSKSAKTIEAPLEFKTPKIAKTSKGVKAALTKTANH